MTGKTIQTSTLAFIKDLEGWRPYAYQDSKGNWTIGFGATWYADWSQRVKSGDRMTIVEGERWLLYHANYFAKKLNALVNVNLNQNQFDAVLSFMYNFGETNFAKSRLRTAINKNPNDVASVRSAFLSYENTKRRTTEADLYATSDGTITPALFGLSTIALIYFGTKYIKSNL